MPDLHDLLERGAADYAPPPDLRARVARRSQRRQRNRHVGIGLAAVLAAAGMVGVPAVLQAPAGLTVSAGPPAPVVGSWVSIDTDGSSQTMDISVVGANYEIVLNDDAASVCSGVPATMTGTGRLDEEIGLIVNSPMLECADGTVPVAVDGSSLEAALRDYTLIHDAPTDTLTDSLGVTWRRAVTPDEPTRDGSRAQLPWPQSDPEDVREAQERADAGDPAYTWQLEPSIGDVGGDAEIFVRYLREVLGWEAFRWGEASGRSASMHWFGSDGISEVDFVRCAAGEDNPMYPAEADPRTCAPTLDEFAYETVRLTAHQPLDDGPEGIWVIERSTPRPPFHQQAPPTDADIAQAVEPFLRARVDGVNAGEFVDSDPTEIPLLYATSDGARYERFDHELLAGPSWPFGDVHLKIRLFANGGQTVVEQAFRLEQGLLEYDGHQYRTTENGVPVPEPYRLLDGQVTFSASRSWETDSAAPTGPDVVAMYLTNQHDQLLTVVASPVAPDGSCEGAQPRSTEEFVRILQVNDELSVSAPVATQVGPLDALQLDITADEGAADCPTGGPMAGPGVVPVVGMMRESASNQWWGLAPDSRARLYLFDVPGTPARTVAILITAPDHAFESVLAAAEPLLDSVRVAEDQ